MSLRTAKNDSSCGPGTFAMSFDMTNPEALAWAQVRSAELVTAIQDEARATIRAIVTDGFESGMAPRDMAKLIRSTVGLTERDARAVARRFSELSADGVKDALVKSERYAAKLLRSRSMTIARTETMRASNEGQQQLWNQALNQGYLTGKERKTWIAADPCPICAPMDGAITGIKEQFAIPGPPAHPNCRCTVGLI
ncbi:Phage head morphogenesis domain containing protein [uncultured Caudovirales phage]|uniref:Phage head morphogenesis domain containing protein n=1 Tax=uncultured Caudovirales phage TaxID=2100421 RepID=A0A6J5R0A6_9CAUD|nr:Phage head morphogenesis domain containing protein [uncultured Caudovirales phage]